MNDRQFSRGGFSRGPSQSRYGGGGSSRGASFSRGANSSRSGGRQSYGCRPAFGGGSNRFQNNRKSFDPSFCVRKATNEVEEVYVPKYAFTDFALCEQLQRNIVRRGYETLTPIQDQAIPLLLEGRDVI